MLPQVVIVLGLTSAVLGQVTLQPSTIRTGRPGLPTITVTSTATETETETETLTKTESYISETTITSTVISTSVSTSVSTSKVTDTVSVTSTVTKPCVTCPTLTRTATACKSCLVPQCTTTQIVTRPVGCDGALPTATVSFPCSDPDACNKIGCTTVYDIKSAAY